MIKGNNRKLILIATSCVLIWGFFLWLLTFEDTLFDGSILALFEAIDPTADYMDWFKIVTLALIILSFGTVVAYWLANLIKKREITDVNFRIIKTSLYTTTVMLAMTYVLNYIGYSTFFVSIMGTSPELLWQQESIDVTEEFYYFVIGLTWLSFAVSIIFTPIMIIKNNLSRKVNNSELAFTKSKYVAFRNLLLAMFVGYIFFLNVIRFGQGVFAFRAVANWLSIIFFIVFLIITIIFPIIYLYMTRGKNKYVNYDKDDSIFVKRSVMIIIANLFLFFLNFFIIKNIYSIGMWLEFDFTSLPGVNPEINDSINVFVNYILGNYSVDIVQGTNSPMYIILFLLNIFSLAIGVIPIVKGFVRKWKMRSKIGDNIISEEKISKR